MAIYSTNGRGHNPQAISANLFGPQVYRYRGTHDRTYIVWTTYGNGTSLTLENMVCYYDHRTGQWSDSVSVGYDTEFGQDIHGKAAILVTDDGHIIVAHEKLRGPWTSAHDGSMLIKISQAAEDISVWNKVELSTDKHAYPKLWKYDGSLYLGYRDSPDFNIDISADGGSTWNDAGERHCVRGAAGDYLAYPQRMWHRDDQGIHVIINWRQMDPASYPLGGYMWSQDGDTWYNVDKSYSWQLSVDGPIAWNGDWRTYCKIIEAANYDDSHGIACGGLSPNGRPYFVCTEKAAGSAIIYYYLYWYEDGQWVRGQIEGVLPAEYVISTGNLILQLMPYSETCIDLLVNKLVGDIAELQLWRTTDRVIWTKAADISTGSEKSHFYIQGTSNHIPTTGKMIVGASYNTDTAYADLDLFEVNKMATIQIPFSADTLQDLYAIAVRPTDLYKFNTVTEAFEENPSRANAAIDATEDDVYLGQYAVQFVDPPAGDYVFWIYVKTAGEVTSGDERVTGFEWSYDGQKEVGREICAGGAFNG